MAILEPERIYFDMDGVLADFRRGVRELGGCELTHEQGHMSPAEDDAMWNAIRKVPRFYDKLEPLPGSLELFRELHDRYGGRCEILTGVPSKRRDLPTSGDEKVSWVRRLLPAGVKVNIVYRREKQGFCKGAQSVLIDDYEKNIAEWEQAGGTGIRFSDARQARDELVRLGLL